MTPLRTQISNPKFQISNLRFQILRSQISNLRFQIFGWKRGTCALALLGLLISGCIGNHPKNPAATQPVTIRDLATTQPAYYLDQPPADTVRTLQFQPLWDACEEVARSYQFRLDRQDYRLGLLTTYPMISKQLLEPWRKDAGTAHAVTENSLATIRRTLRFEINRGEDGAYVMTPKVLVERLTVVERRLTAAVQFRSAFSGPAAESKSSVEAESDLPPRYWTPIARDTAMEQDVADQVRRRMRRTR